MKMSQGVLTELPVSAENKKGWPWIEESSPELYNGRTNWPRISIITPSYNQGIYLEETLRSVLLQNYPNLELIVIDGGSKDESVSIIEKYAPWITYWVSEKDIGQSDALNKGFRKVTGDIVTWLNSDDLFTQNTLLRVAEIFSELSEDVGLVFGGTTLFEGDKILQTDFGYEEPCIERFISGQAFSQPSAFFKRKYLSEAGCWVREDLHLGMDYDIFARLSCVCRFHKVKDIFSLYRLHENSKTVTQHSGLVGDWTKTFSNLCKNFEWTDILDKMKTFSFLETNMNYYYALPFGEKLSITGSIDKEKALFYHLCYWLKSFYWYNDLSSAKKLLIDLKNNYPQELLKKEKDILPIMRKLALPGFVLQILKKAKRML